MNTPNTPDLKTTLFFRGLFQWVTTLIKTLEERLHSGALLNNINGTRYVKGVFYACLLTTPVSYTHLTLPTIYSV